jgi:hypothetical protein
MAAVAGDQRDQGLCNRPPVFFGCLHIGWWQGWRGERGRSHLRWHLLPRSAAGCSDRAGPTYVRLRPPEQDRARYWITVWRCLVRSRNAQPASSTATAASAAPPIRGTESPAAAGWRGAVTARQGAGWCLGTGPGKVTSAWLTKMAFSCTGQQRCGAAPDPGRILIPHQPGQCRRSDDHAGDKRRYQRVARRYGREQPASRAGQDRGDHGDHPGDGQELLPQADPQPRGRAVPRG